MAVFVLGKRKKPLMPCSEKRVRLVVARGRAGVHPLTIRLKDRAGGDVSPGRVKIDPGSKTTGVWRSALPPPAKPGGLEPGRLG